MVGVAAYDLTTMTSPRPWLRGAWGVCVIACLVLGSGCAGHPVQRKLAGRWHGETVENLDGAELAAATGWVKGTTLEFSGNTLTVAIPAEEPRTGKYRVVRVNKDQVDLAVTRPDGATDQVALKLEGERSLRWVIGDGRYIVLRREY
jgi:hypothetical protein